MGGHRMQDAGCKMQDLKSCALHFASPEGILMNTCNAKENVDASGEIAVRRGKGAIQVR
jgi:hypothetical protein